jgi:phage terminase small subunit
MNKKQERFVTYYVKHWDGIKALTQAGYDTHNEVSAKAALRRLLDREDVKAVIDKHVNHVNVDEMEDKEAAIAFCWERIKARDRHSATFLTNLLKLKGWDKGDQEDTDAEPPSFARMPFTPVAEGK